MKKTNIARALALAAIASLLVGGLSPARAALRVPKATWPACSVSPGTYCVDSVVVTDARGRQIPLVWVPSGQAAPAAKPVSALPMYDVYIYIRIHTENSHVYHAFNHT